MFAYYVRLAAISIRRKRGNVGADGVRGGARHRRLHDLRQHHLCALEGFRIPAKSDVLYAVQLDTWSPDNPFRPDGTPPTQLTYLDATALMQAQYSDEPPAFRHSGHGAHGIRRRTRGRRRAAVRCRRARRLRRLLRDVRRAVPLRPRLGRGSRCGDGNKWPCSRAPSTNACSAARTPWAATCS